MTATATATPAKRAAKPDQRRTLHPQSLAPLAPGPAGDLMRSLAQRRARAAEASDLACLATKARIATAEAELDRAREALRDLPTAASDGILESLELALEAHYKELAKHRERVANEQQRGAAQERIDSLRDNAQIIVESAQQALDRAHQLLLRVRSVDAEARTLKGLHGHSPARIFEHAFDANLVESLVPQIRRSQRGDWILERRPPM